jgi:hypothetical protein
MNHSGGSEFVRTVIGIAIFLLVLFHVLVLLG